MDYLNKFEVYLDKEKKVSKSTLSAYMNDAAEYEKWLNGRGISLEKAHGEDVSSFFVYLERLGKSKATINRKICSVRSLYAFLKSIGKISSNPADSVKTTAVERGELEYLSVEEMEKLLAAPDESEKGIRDKALLELMYATGLRPTEVCNLKIDDINLKIGYVNILNSDKPRVVPIGKMAKQALVAYIDNARTVLLCGKDDTGILFLSYLGDKLTRQGIWKILRLNAEKAGLEKKISPQIIRNSFAAHLIQNGADLKSLQELLGHEDITATKIYLTVSKNRILDVYGKAFPRA